MTIETTQSAQTMNGDGARRVFPFTFTAWANQLKAIITAPDGTETDVTERSSFTLEDEAGGSVTYPANTGTPALPAGWKFTVMRAMNFKQETDLVTGGQYRSEVIEDRMDRLTAQDQELLEKINRAVLVPVASGEKPPTTEELFKEVVGYTNRAETAAASAENSRDRAESAATSAASSSKTAQTAASSSSTSATAASGSAELARKWAVNPYGNIVQNGQYSAWHWAQVATEKADEVDMDLIRGMSGRVNALEAILAQVIDGCCGGSIKPMQDDGLVSVPATIFIDEGYITDPPQIYQDDGYIIL